GPFPQFVQRAELDRLGRAGLGAGRGQAVADPVVAQRALVRAAVGFPPPDHAERAGGDAVAAAVADVVLDHHGAELGAHQRARGADVQAAGLGAVLAHVAGHQPAGLPRAGYLLHERDVPPGEGAQAPGVVVRHAGQLEAVLRDRVPLLARDLARL